ncbi:hypothetical protein HanRHA438_Chr13g0613511 [Helianthus annuus]|nr:hypothetical protein HanIR_Chr13g0655281 [Helianthus annuus]KAJ0859510.1 hypothetical protein HanRHA438_Chr13g0613511 [Helianthus annuus]
MHKAVWARWAESEYGMIGILFFINTMTTLMGTRMRDMEEPSKIMTWWSEC